jgi:translation initiation factor IF-2
MRVQVHEGTCASLKRHKLDVERVGKGSECGVLLDGFKVLDTSAAFLP